MFFAKKILISVCIPVFETESTLVECLNSVADQSFKEIEVIIVDDGSSALSFDSVQKIVKNFKKSVKFPVKLISHNSNKGLLEARRTAIYEAKGEYITILDSDDTLAGDALKILYENAVKTGASIVHGTANVVDFTDDDALTKARYKASNVYDGILCGTEILDGYLLKKNHTGILWAKLIQRELYLEALSHIPLVFCTMAEDVLQYFWICFEAAKCGARYCGIKDSVYNYSVKSGISSHTLINDISRWEKVCSASSVFSSIFLELDENPSPDFKLSQDCMKALHILCAAYLSNNIEQLEKSVAPELKDEAKKMLCEYWGEDFVSLISVQ